MMRVAALLLCVQLYVQLLSQTVQLQSFATGFTRPVDIAHCNDDRLFIAQRDGRIKIIQGGTVLSTPLLDMSSLVPQYTPDNERGLLGVAFHPQFASNGYLYVYYTAGTGNGSLRVTRFTAVGNTASLATAVTVWDAGLAVNLHNGGDIDFGPDGYLYFAPGDGGTGNLGPDQAQTLSTALGKLHRIDVSTQPYTVPPSNPYVGTPGALPTIFAIGLRNPWRFGFDRVTGDLWIGDVGEGAKEEVDRLPGGTTTALNFGWRCREGTVQTPGAPQDNCPPLATFTPPVIDYTVVHGSAASVIGGRVYRGLKYPYLYGRYIYTDYFNGILRSLRPNGSGGWIAETLIPTGTLGIAAIGEDRCGDLYAANTSTGTIFRIVDTSTCPEDVNRDGVVKYVGASNDRDPILTYIGGTVPTNIVPCACCLEDVNGDGVVKYVGTGNDRDPILIKIGGVVPTNTSTCQ